MRRRICIVILSLSLLFIFSCHKAKKDMADYFPKITTSAAKLTSEGDVIVEAELISSGTKPLEYVGFCVDTIPVPSMLSNQVLIEQLNGATTYSIQYDNVSTLLPYHQFKTNKPYYFRSFAVNGNGYVYGNIVSVANVSSTPVVPSCSLMANTISIFGGIGGQVNNVSSLYLNVNNNYVISTQDVFVYNVSLEFGSKPRNKVFKVTGNFPGQNEVRLIFSAPNYIVENGSNVYVNEVSPGVFDITICQAPFKANGSTYYVNARYISPT